MKLRFRVICTKMDERDMRDMWINVGHDESPGFVPIMRDLSKSGRVYELTDVRCSDEDLHECGPEDWRIVPVA